MLQGTTFIALLAFGIALANTLSTPVKDSTNPNIGTKGWNELVKGAGIFDENVNNIQSKSYNAAGVLDEFILLLSQDKNLEMAYHNYRALFKEEYDTGSGNIRLFKQKLVDIAKHNLEANSGGHSWWMGVNQFTDMTSAELRGFIGDKKYDTDNAHSTAVRFLSEPGVALPASFNSVADGWVPSVGNRHGAAYGEEFAVVALVEVSFGVKGKQRLPFSVQEMINCQPGWCSEYTGDCHGTSIEKLLQYPITNGLSPENFLLYKNPPTKGPCPSPTSPMVLLSAPTVTKGNSEEELKELLVKYGSAVVGVYFSESLLSEYGGGVYPGSECGTNAPNQVLTLVGYGSEGGQDYWLLKNSIGQKWGEQGYLRLARNGGNVCGILGPAYAAASP